jgi:hypothetical protein
MSQWPGGHSEFNASFSIGFWNGFSIANSSFGGCGGGAGRLGVGNAGGSLWHGCQLELRHGRPGVTESCGRAAYTIVCNVRVVKDWIGLNQIRMALPWLGVIHGDSGPDGPALSWARQPEI